VQRFAALPCRQRLKQMDRAFGYRVCSWPGIYGMVLHCTHAGEFAWLLMVAQHPATKTIAVFHPIIYGAYSFYLEVPIKMFSVHRFLLRTIAVRRARTSRTFKSRWQSSLCRWKHFICNRAVTGLVSSAAGKLIDAFCQGWCNHIFATKYVYTTT